MKTPVLDPLFNKVARLQTFSSEISEIFKNNLFFTEHLRWMLLAYLGLYQTSTMDKKIVNNL